MKILAIDPGEKRIGIAISDPSGTIANPLSVIKHVSRKTNASRIVQIAIDHQVGLILVGQALDDEGHPTPQGRSATRLAKEISTLTQIPLLLWDESGSTQAAQAASIAMGVSRRKRRGHLDDLAATYILQTYLDAQFERTNTDLTNR